MFGVESYLNKIAGIFEKNGNNQIAIEQSKYLKNHFIFYGIKSPLRKALISGFFKEENIPTPDNFEEVTKEAYQFPQREMHYFAIAVVEKGKKHLNPNHLSLIKWLIENNAWWDTVDLLASHFVGHLLKKYPDLTNEMDNWIVSENMWLRRSAILYQLGYKDKTDSERLFKYCSKLSHEKEFFIRKAIGWSLRQYSKVNSEAVKEFVDTFPLSNLSKKEALKYF